MAKERLKSPRARLFVALDLPEALREGIVAWGRRELDDPALQAGPPPPPLPRPRPKLAATDSSDAKPAAEAAPPSPPKAESKPANDHETTGTVTTPANPAAAPVEEYE